MAGSRLHQRSKPFAAIALTAAIARTSDSLSVRTKLGTVPEFHRELKLGALQGYLDPKALEGTLATLRKRIGSFEAQTDLAASTDFPQDA